MFNFPTHIRKVFRDDKLQSDFEKNGYVILDFYDADEVSSLLGLYRDLHPEDEKGFYPSTFSKDKNYRKKADEAIRMTGSRSMKNYLQDVKVVCGSYIVKSPGEESIMEVHQDMTLVDESEFTGINIWCPLIDLNENNGLLYVLPGSHRFFPTYRGASIPTIYANVYEEVKSYSIPLFLKAGEAVFFDQSILHWSKPNLSNDVRPVTNTYFTHEEARFQICYFDASDNLPQIEIFEESADFMTDFEQFGENIYDRPRIGKSLGFQPYDFPLLTAEFLGERFGKKESISFQPKKNEPAAPEKNTNRFWKVYTPLNVLRELKYRLTGR